MWHVHVETTWICWVLGALGLICTSSELREELIFTSSARCALRLAKSNNTQTPFSIRKPSAADRHVGLIRSSNGPVRNPRGHSLAD